MNTDQTDQTDLTDRITLVTGATRGAGRAIAVALAERGATVWITGRSAEGHRGDYDRAETLEQTAELVEAAGGKAFLRRVDHLVPEQVAGLAAAIEAEHGRLDVLVDDVWGGEELFMPAKPIWEHELSKSLRMIELAVTSHLITAHHLLGLVVRQPGGLVVEVTDGTWEYNETRYREQLAFDVAKNALIRMAFGLQHELEPHGGTAVCISPGFLRSEMMLDTFGVTEDNWLDATKQEPHFAIAETPAYVGRAIAAIAADPEKARWGGRSTSSGEVAIDYGIRDLDGSQPDGWRYFIEVVDGGADRTAADYR